MKENFVQLWVIYFESWWKKILYSSWVIYFESSPFHLASYLFSVQNTFKTVVIFAGPNYQTVKWY